MRPLIILATQTSSAGLMAMSVNSIVPPLTNPSGGEIGPSVLCQPGSKPHEVYRGMNK
jgi:hypothetical protein